MHSMSCSLSRLPSGVPFHAHLEFTMPSMSCCHALQVVLPCPSMSCCHHALHEVFRQQLPVHHALHDSKELQLPSHIKMLLLVHVIHEFYHLLNKFHFHIVLHLQICGHANVPNGYDITGVYMGKKQHGCMAWNLQFS